MSLLVSLRSEVLKTKRTAAFYFTLIGAGVVPFMFLFSIMSHGLPEQQRTAKDPINAMFHMSSEINGLAIFPLFVVLICTLLPQIEYKNAAWKQVLTSPQKKEDVFVAKFLNIHLLMLLFLVASHLFMWLVIITAHLVIPELHILNHSFDGYKVIAQSAHSYLAVLGICAIQFWIGLRSRNFIVPIAIGIACWLVGTIMVFEYNSSASPYFPFSFPAIRFSEIFRPKLNQVEWTSFGYSVLFLLLGFLDFKRRRMTK